ncbi:MAG: diguanylate cyclase [Cyanobacteriota bacterium]|nr:diguanylate cyclase [Cyanobacteriota bacterium]
MTEASGSQGRSRRPAWALLASLSVLVGLVIGGASYQYSRRLIEQSQERARAALAQGLVVALSDQLVIHDYAGMESRLQQAMADPSLTSAVVTDPSGKVLVHLERARSETEPVLLFEPKRLAPPDKEHPSSSRSGPISTRWTTIDAGMEPLGWLQLRTWSTSTDAVLTLLARQYLVLGALAAALLGTLVVSAQHQLHKQSQQRERLLQQENAELEQKALSDPLTGVWNRRGVERELQAWLDVPQTGNRTQLAVCMIDLDDFKPVNDTYGHATGDQVLIAVTRRLRGVLREGDLLGRIGGDELIAVFRECAEAEIARQLASRIVNSLKAPFIFHHLEVRIGASIGLALNDEDGNESLAALLARADQAMYVAKQAGKGHLVMAVPPSLAKPSAATAPPPAELPAAQHL